VVVVGVDYTLTGSLAQFSRGGIVRELANALTAQFAARLAARLPQAVEASSTPSTEALPPPNTPLDGGSLLALVLRSRWRRFVAWLRRRAPA
jgi:hypothetical protein